MTREEKIKAIIEDTDRNYAPYYQVLPDLIKKHGYKSGIEIGVFCGGHAEAILNTGCHLVGIDPYKMYEPGMPGLETQEDWDLLYQLTMKRLNFGIKIGSLKTCNLKDAYDYYHIRKDSNTAFDLFKINSLADFYSETSYKYVNANISAKFDFIFIDGLHTYDQLKQDLENYSQLINEGGVIACHDYNHGSFPELTVAIDEFVAKHKKRLIIGPLHLVYFYW